MKQLVLVGLLALLATGCASTSSVDQLQQRVDAIEANTKLTNAEIQSLKQACDQMQKSAKEQHLKCDEHCKLLDSKLDRVFKKSQLK